MSNTITYIRAQLDAIDSFRTAMFVMFVALFLMSPGMEALATGSAFNTVICRAVNIVTTDAAKAIATAAVVTIAIGALLGRVSWGMAVMIGVGIAGLFSAPYIANFVGTGTWASEGGFCTSVNGA